MNGYKDKCVDIKQYASTLINKLKDVDINNVGTAYENMLSRDAIEKLNELTGLIHDKVNAFYGQDDEADEDKKFPYLVETGDYGVWLRTDRREGIKGHDILVKPKTILVAIDKVKSDGITWLKVKYGSFNDPTYWISEESTFDSLLNYTPPAPIATSFNIDWDIISKMDLDTNVSKPLDIKRAFNINKIPIFDTPLEGHALIDIIEPQKENGTVLLSNHTFFNNESIPSESGMNFVAKTENGFSFKAIKYGPKKYGYVNSAYINYDVWEKQ